MAFIYSAQFSSILIFTEERTTLRTTTTGTLSERDTEILEVLVRNVRVLSVAQLGRTWWKGSSNPELSAWTRVQALSAAGFTKTFEGLSHPELALDSPVSSWAPALPAPEPGPVSYQLKSRWTLHPERTKCVSASLTAKRYFGAPLGRQPRERELTHDIHLSAVYLRIRDEEPELARYWAYEETIVEARKSRREKLPDAIIVAPELTKVIEFGGSYGKKKIQAFHAYCEEQELSYELW